MYNKNEITIIMPVYNCEKYLEKTINSIKQQTFKDWKLIIVDDCSTDNSASVIEANIQDIQDKVLFIKLEENKGVANARNLALDLAESTYVAYLDADDFWEKDKLEKQWNFMKENNYCFTYTSFKYLKGDNIKNVRLFPKYFTYKKALKNTMILTSTVMINIEEIPKDLLIMPDIRRGQDAATWWNILKNGYIAFGLNDRLSYYRRRKQSLSFKKMSAMKRTWYLYKNVEKMPILKALYYFDFYAINAVLRRII